MTKKEKFEYALKMFGDGHYRYYDGVSANGIGCSKYVEMSLRAAGIIRSGETFHAGSGFAGVLTDTSRFRKIPWNKDDLQPLDILWSNGHHVAVWDGNNGVYEAAPESTHGICANGKTGVGHWPNHTFYNCGTGSKTWSCIYRIIDQENITRSMIEEAELDKTKNLETLIDFLPDVAYGSRSNTVKALQTILKKYGWYAGNIDGHAGQKTVAGIRLLQTALGVTVDGQAGKETWTALLM